MNCSGTVRYTVVRVVFQPENEAFPTLPKSVKHRIDVMKPTVPAPVIASLWIANSVNFVCVETKDSECSVEASRLRGE